MTETMYESVAVALDLGVEADRALPIGQALAARLRAELDVLVVSTAGVDPADDVSEVRAHAKANGVAVDTVRIRYDEDVAAGLVAEAATGIRLLCLATRARGPVAEVILGSVSTDVVRRTEQPVLLVGPKVVTRPPPSFGAVVAGVEGAGGAERVADVAGRWAAGLGVQAHLLRVEPNGAMEAEARRQPSGAAGVMASSGMAGAEISYEVVAHDRPAERIIASAAQLEGPVIVIGNDRSRRGRRALGEVGSALVRDALFPVLVVP